MSEPASHTASHQDDGFTLIEVLVAFAILALGLAAVYADIGDSARALREMELRDTLAAEAQSHLDRLVATPLAAGTSHGQYANGLTWRVDVTPLRRATGIAETALGPAEVVLVARDGRGRTLLSLWSIAFVARAP